MSDLITISASLPIFFILLFYDSVKSYKAFLKKVTENKDLDVEVKELENYQKPKIKSNSEHCVVVEEESEGRSGDIAKLINFLPSMKKQVIWKLMKGNTMYDKIRLSQS